MSDQPYWTRNRKVTLGLSTLSLGLFVVGVLLAPGFVAGALLYASTMAAYNAGRFSERNSKAWTEARPVGGA